MPGSASLMTCVVAAACAWLTPPTEPSQASPPARAQTQQDPQGCRKVQFTIVGDTAVTGVYPDTACGMQLELVAAGAMGWSGDTLSIPFRLRNRSGSSVLLPVRLEVRDSGIVALEPEEAPTADVVALNMDSTLSGGRRVWLVGGSGALADGDSTGVATLLFRVDTPVTEAAFAFELVGHEGFVVAMMPPDFRPDWFSHDSSYFQVGGIQKRVLMVRYDSDATVGDRTAVVGAVNGQVVGGLRFTTPDEGGYYYIRVPGNPSVAELDSLAGVLQVQPKVGFASVGLQGAGVMGIRPNDGSGWQRSDWRFNPDFSSGDTWAYEEISAPLAWGCSLGSGATKIAVLDMFFDHTEVDSNVVAPLPPYGRNPMETNRHGTAVAGILASPGDNGTGMAGVMWKGAVRLHDFEAAVVGWEDQVKGILAVAESGYQVVNLSIGSEWGTADSADVIVAMQIVLSRLRQATVELPLVIVPAGNMNADAWHSVWPALRDSLSGHILVVGGSRKSTPRDRWGGGGFTEGWYAGSNYGPLIDVYAPAENVYVPTANGSIVTAIGTSFAAPLVTGIAGLLKSFDPSLTSSAIRTLIIQGAEAGNRPMASHSTRYLANAYESLKLAAKKSGGPLCGNQVWALGTKLYAERDTAELLLDTSAPASLFRVSTHHGGRALGYAYYHQSVWHAGAALFNGTAWTTSGQAPVSPPGGATVSSWGFSHDYDAWVWGSAGANHYTEIPIYFGADTLPFDGEIASFPVPEAGEQYFVCVFHDGSECQETVDIIAIANVSMGWDPGPALALRPMGDTVLVAIPYVHVYNPGSIPSACSWGMGHSCPIATAERRVDSTTVFAVATTGTAPTRLWSQPGLIAQLGVADDNQGHVVAVVHDTSYVTVRYSIGGSLPSSYTGGCRVQCRRGYSGSPDRDIATACAGLVGSIAPIVASDMTNQRR